MDVFFCVSVRRGSIWFQYQRGKVSIDESYTDTYDSLCVSNQFQEDEVTISFLNGIVILMETKDR